LKSILPSRELGFADYCYFSRSFNEASGMSPLKFRMQEGIELKFNEFSVALPENNLLPFNV